ncbi:MAG: B12-binding domain-containing radical SAM protein [Candidatus Xenobiia bacterium LiM19]
MKVALLEASTLDKERHIFYPLGLAYLAGYLKKALPDVEVYISSDFDEFMERGADLAGISATSPAYQVAAQLAQRIKREHNIPVILGGAHISTFPESLDPSFDAAVIGEGEETFSEVVRYFINHKKSAGVKDMMDISGLAVHLDGRVGRTPSRPPISDLDSLPFPMRIWRGIQPHLQWLFSSRGCPGKCAFCASPRLWKGYRAHSPAHVLAELRELISRFGLSFFIFMDDLFAVDRKRVEAMKTLFSRELAQKLSLTVTLRAELATESMTSLLREMGAGFVHLGLESGSERVLNYLKGTASHVKTNEKALEICSSSGLHAVGSFIIGAPDETEEELDETYRFIKKSMDRGIMKSFSFSPLVTFPGTAVWDYAIAKGLISPQKMNWRALDIDLRHFDGRGYVLLTDRMSRERFMYHFRRFKALYDESLASVMNQSSHKGT